MRNSNVTTGSAWRKWRRGQGGRWHDKGGSAGAGDLNLPKYWLLNSGLSLGASEAGGSADGREGAAQEVPEAGRGEGSGQAEDQGQGQHQT